LDVKSRNTECLYVSTVRTLAMGAVQKVIDDRIVGVSSTVFQQATHLES
jgi:hypothetical protein